MLSKLWILFILFAIMYAFNAISGSALVKGKDTVKVVGEIIDSRIQSSGMGMTTYAPVYKYKVNGKEMTCIGSATQMAPHTIGSKITLYYNMKKNKLVEPLMNTSNWILAVFFSLISLATMALTR